MGVDPMFGMDDAAPQGYGGVLPGDEGEDSGGEGYIPY
jgi:hypothetical protein